MGKKLRSDGIPLRMLKFYKAGMFVKVINKDNCQCLFIYLLSSVGMFSSKMSKKMLNEWLQNS